MLLLFKRKPVIMFDFQRVSFTLFCDVSTTLQLKKPRIVRNKGKVIGMRSLEERNEEQVWNANSQSSIHSSGFTVNTWRICHIPGLYPRSI